MVRYLERNSQRKESPWLSRVAFCWFFCFLPLNIHAQYHVKNMIEEGRENLKAGQYLVAMQLFNRIVMLKPQMYEPWFLMAQAKYHLEDYEGSQHDATKAIDLNPYIGGLFDLRAMCAIRQKQFEQGAEDYTKAIELEPDNKDYWFNRAWCYDQGGQTTIARQQLEYILSRWPHYRQAHRLLLEINKGNRRSAKSESKVLNVRRWQPSVK